MRGAATQAILERLIVGVGRIAAAILITRLLGIEAQGVFALVVTTWAVAYVATSLGLDVANTFYSAQDEGDGRLVSIILGNTLVLSLACGITSSVVIVATYRYTNILDVVPEGMGVVLIVGALATLLNMAIGGIVYGLKLLGHRVIGSMVQQVLLIASAVLSYMMAGGVEMLLTGWVVSLMAPVIYWGLIIMTKTEGAIRFDPGIGLIHIRYGIKASAFNAINTALYRFDAFVIAAIVNDTYLLGIYTLCATISESVLYIPKAMSSLIVVKGAKEKVIDVKNIRSIMTICVTMIVAGVIVGPLGLRYVFGIQDVLASIVLGVLLVSVGALSLGLLGAYALFGLDMGAKSISASLVAAVFSVVSGILLVMNFGIVGAAVSSLISYSVLACIMSMKISTVTGGKAWDLVKPYSIKYAVTK